MKLHVIALAAVAAFAGSAHAVKPTALQAAAAPFQLNIHGSSALQKLVEGMISQNCDVPADFAIWRSAKQTWFGSTTADTADGASANVYSCVMKVGNDFGSTYDNQLVTVYKREAGGSSQGVYPVAKRAAVAANNQRSMLFSACDATADTQAGGTYGLCTGESTALPDMGISDQEPAVYSTSINRATAFPSTLIVNEATEFEGGAAVPFAQAVMGLVVNDKLYADLQADQGTTGVPSVSSVGFANLWSSTYNPASGWSPLCKDPYSCAALPLANTNINLAVRAIGSGTRAAAGLFFNNTPSGKVSKQWAGGSSTNTFSAAVTGGRSVFNASSGGNVVGALDACGDGTAASPRYCIGILGREVDLTGKKVKFVNVDNSAPDGAKFGQYGIVYEATYQISSAAPAAAKALGLAFGTAASKPNNINQAFNGLGVLALPSACGATFPFSGVEAIVCSRVTRSGNSNNTLSITK